MSEKEVTAIAKTSRKYYLLFNLPIQLLTVIFLLALPLDYVKLASWAIAFYVAVYWIGIQAGSHKLFSHKSWEPRFTWMKYVIAYLGCFGLMGGPVTWTNLHRWHHVHSDSDKDPHSPKHGLLHSYVGWLMNPPAIPFMVVRDLLRDNVIVWIDAHSKSLVIGTLLALAVIDYQVAVALMLAMTVTFNAEMSVNTFLHGQVKGEWTAKNNSWLAIPSGGSTLHLNHHNSPGAYSFAKYWYQVDLSAAIIRLLKK